MPVEQVAEFQILAEPVEALVPAEALELGGVGSGSMPVLRAPRFGLWPPNSCPANPAAAVRPWTMRDGARRQRSGAAWAGSQRRRNTGPSVIAAASSQQASACTGQSSVLP
jgi:hypothetical protein